MTVVSGEGSPGSPPVTRPSDPSPDPAESPPGRSALDRLWWTPLLLIGAVLVLGLVALARPRWYPTGDLAQNNLRMLSFWDHPPLVGAAGRITGPGGVQGYHPGPLMFWTTWPLWRLLGATSWALNASVAAVNLLAATLAVVSARKAAGACAAWAFGGVALVLVAGYGPDVIYAPWNPSMPLMWFLTVLAATWAVLCGRVGLLPVLAGAACFVVQTHVSLVPITLGLCALAGGWVVAGLVAAEDRRRELRRVGPWVAVSVVLAGVLWVPPVLEQLTDDPGNFASLRHSFTHPDGDYVGLGRALHILVLQLDPTGGWLRGEERIHGAPLAGATLLVAWAATWWASRHRLERAWQRLDVVLAVALTGAWLSISRIFGLPFVYLFKWTWALSGLLVVATVVHGLTLVRARHPGLRGRRWDRVVLGAVGGLALIGLIAGTLRYGGAERPAPRHSDTVAALIGPTERRLDPDSTYLMEWSDPAALGGIAFGMLLELERRGFDVGVGEPFGPGLETHRVRSPGEVDRTLTVATGSEAIERALDRPGAELVARYDPRSPAERERADQLMAHLTRRLDEIGRPELAASLAQGGNLVGAALDESLPEDVNRDLRELLDLFLPTAIILGPPPR